MGSTSSPPAAPRNMLIVGSQAPSLLCVPEYVSSAGDEAVELAALAGLIADPAQRLIAQHSLGERADGKWAARDIGLLEPRQNGKGGSIEIRELAGLFLLDERLIIHSAHEFPTSLEAFFRMLELIETCPDFDRRVKRISRSHGEEGIELKGGQRLRYRTRTKGGGRGFSGDLLILDEAMDIPEAVHGALLPTLSARANPQVWYCGSAVDQATMDDGLVFARVRKRAQDRSDPRLAFFGWEARRRGGAPFEHPDDVDAESAADPEVWASANPALGDRISLESVEGERRAMAHRTFAVERLNIGDWPDPDPEAGRTISAEAWNACADPASRPLDPVCFSVDVPPNRGSAAIGAAGRRADGRTHVEIVDQRAGTAWLGDRLVGLVERNQPVGVVIAKASPAASLIRALELALESTDLPVNEKTGMRITVIEVADQAKAAGTFYDAVTDLTLVHLGTTELAAAVRGAETRPLGDAWLWSRKTSAVNIAPLIAATNARWGLATIEPPKRKVPLSAMRMRRL
jgi:hypothetical protein